MAGGGKTYDLEVTPTWIVAAVCSLIVILSLLFERGLHYVGKLTNKRSQKSLYEAVLKVKEELMLLGFISLLLSVFQGPIGRICIPSSYLEHMLPCTIQDWRSESEDQKYKNHCEKEGKEELLSLGAIHQLHIFIFVLAVTHVVLSVFTICLGGLMIRRWKSWEQTIANKADQNGEFKVTQVAQDPFIMKRSKPRIVSWLHSFVKQFYASITESDYETLRRGFIKMHCGGNPQFNFHKFILRAYEHDFKKVVGISWYFWVFVVVFLLMNVGGWQTLFWMTLIPLVLLLAVGTKLEHIVTQLAKDVAEKHTAVEGDVVVQPSDDHFWFHRPCLLLHLIHFILFQNAFEIAFFFWLWVTYGFSSCIMGKLSFLIPRLIFGVIIQVLCSFSTLPIYAIVTQMGNSFKKTMFDEHVQENLVKLAQKARRKAAGQMSNQASQSRTSTYSTQTTHAGNRSPDEIQLQEAPLVHAGPSNAPMTSKLEASPAKEKHMGANM